MCVYTENGFSNRADYLRQLAEDNDYDLEHVRLVADLLGPDEDFDGLVTDLADHYWLDDFAGCVT